MFPQDRLLPLQVAALVFLAALAGAGGLAATGLADRWRQAGDGTIVQVPEANAAAAAALLGPAAHRLSPAEVAAALKPFLGEDAVRPAIPLPAVFTLAASPPQGAEQALARAVPDALVSHGTVWQQRAAALAGSLTSGAVLVAASVALLAAGGLAMTTRAALSASRESLEIVHQLGATDGQIAFRLAAGASLRTLAGAAVGSAAAVPVLLVLVRLMAALQPLPPGEVPASLPSAVWGLLAALPLLAALVGWSAAQATARAWLRRLP